MADPPRKRMPPPIPRRVPPAPPSTRIEPREGPPSRKHAQPMPRKMTMEVDVAWLIPSMPPPPVTQKSATDAPHSRRPHPKPTVEVQLDWLEEERPALRRRGPPPLPQQPAHPAPRKGPPPLPTAVAKPRRALPPPLPREEPVEAAKKSVRPRKP